MDLDAPTEANRVATQILAELKELKKMEEEPSAAERILAEMGLQGSTGIEDRSESSFLWAARPTSGRV